MCRIQSFICIFCHLKVVGAVLAKQTSVNWIPLSQFQFHQILESKGASFPSWIKNMIPALPCPGLIYAEWMIVVRRDTTLCVTVSFIQYLNTSHLPGVEFLISMIVINYHTTYKCLSNIVWRALIWKFLGLSPRVTASHWSCTQLHLVVNLLWARLLDDSQPTSNLHTSTIAQPASEISSGLEVYPIPCNLILGFQRVILMLVVIGHAFWGFLKAFLTGNSPNNTCRICSYRNTHSS